MGDRIAILKDGALVQTTTPTSLRPPTPFVGSSAPIAL
jgi:ABC-type proline/glycine betaine transport system ATPase subunit